MTIWTSKTQVMAKRKVGSQIGSLTPNHKKAGIDPIPLRAGGMQHTIGKLLTRLQFCFKLHLNQRSTSKVIGLQNRKNPNFGN
jgi:hypothetical protein